MEYLPFSVSFENCTMLAERQVIDQVSAADNDESTSQPQGAGVAAENDLIFRL